MKSSPASPKLVNSAVYELQVAGVGASGRVLAGQGHVGRKMLKAAEADGADLIVLGARAMSRLEEVTIGRASNKIVHAAKVPVLLVR